MNNSSIQLAIKKRTREIEILTCLENYKRILYESIGMGAGVLRKLSESREKLDEIHHRLKKINNDLDESDEHTNVISGFIDSLKNFFIRHEKNEELDAAKVIQTSAEKYHSENDNPRKKLEKGDIAVDPNDFQSILNSELQVINDLINELLGCAIEINHELDEQNSLIEDENRECAEVQDKLNKETEARENF